MLGTHALLYEGVDFADLGLVVVDEQHRFGVEQRDALRAKAAEPPHVLVMTATPIPRTVAMTVYGDLDTSTLAELPLGRSPIASHVVPAAEKPAYLDRAWRRLREEVEAGHQAYVVCPRIGDSAGDGPDDDVEPGIDADSARRPPLAVTEVAPLLAAGPLAGLRLGVLHGRLPSDEKDAVMRAFAGRRDRRARRDDGDRGRRRRAERHRDDRARRRPVRRVPAAPAARPGRPGHARRACACWSPRRARTRRPGSGWTRSRPRWTDSGWPRSTWSSAGRATCSAQSQSGRRSHLRLLSLLRDAELIGEARTAAIELVDDDPELDRHPLLRDSVAALVDEERAEYLEKG